MSNHEKTSNPAAPFDPDESEQDELRKLLRGSYREESMPAPDVLSGVQRKLRERSGGKFYADRWATSKHPPIKVYLVTSTLMLLIVVISYAVMKPIVGEAVAVPMSPAPVHVLPPPQTR